MHLFEQANEVCNEATKNAFLEMVNAIINPSLAANNIPAPATSRADPPTVPPPIYPLYFLLFLFLLAQAPAPAACAVDRLPIVPERAAAMPWFLFFLLFGPLDPVQEARIPAPLTCRRLALSAYPRPVLLVTLRCIPFFLFSFFIL